jgi:hypothetical protein
MTWATDGFFIGMGATLATDLWAIARRRLFSTPLPNYRLVGRWVLHMRHGQFHHDRIATAPPVRGEHLAGWLTHYVVGVGFGLGFAWIFGPGWLHQPTLLPALGYGIATVTAPFLLMQPGMGAGVAARRTPRPDAARLQSLVTHAVFGLGLYLSGLALNLAMQAG